MSEFKAFPGFSEMSVSDGTFRVSWDSFHEKMTISFIKQGVFVQLFLSCQQGEDAGNELVRLAQAAKAKAEIPQVQETPVQ
jgi:hypothetical protein